MSSDIIFFTFHFPLFILFRIFVPRNNNILGMMKRIFLFFLLLQTSVISFAQDIEELTDTLPSDVLWHAGSRLTNIDQINELYQQPIKLKHYNIQGHEVLVVRHKKTNVLIDVFRRIKDNSYVGNEVVQAYLSLLNGIYQNEKGKSTFGYISFSHEEINEGGLSSGDPGIDLRPEIEIGYDSVKITDILYWGMSRIVQRYDMPKDAPPGWGGHGAIAGPTKWRIRFTNSGLACEELESPQYCETYPAFGKEFLLVKIRGPYEYTRDPWAVVSEEPMVRDLLVRLAPRQLNAMLTELKTRHADGSALSPLEKLNRELILSVLAKKKK